MEKERPEVKGDKMLTDEKSFFPELRKAHPKCLIWDKKIKKKMKHVDTVWINASTQKNQEAV